MSDTPHARLAALAEPAAAPAEQLPRLRKFLETLLRRECQQRKAPFSNLSQAIGWAGYALALPADLGRRLHALRLAANLVLHESHPGTPAEAAAGFGALAELLGHLTAEKYAGPWPEGAAEAPAGHSAAAEQIAAELPVAPGPAAVWRVQVLHVDLGSGVLTVEMAEPADDRPAGPFPVVLPGAYDNLLPLAAALHPGLNLIGPVRGPDGRYLPRRVVLEPDYLINVTTLAECALKDGTVPELGVLHSFLPDEVSRPLAVGNLVNILLDEEVSHAAREVSVSSEQLAVSSEQLIKSNGSATDAETQTTKHPAPSTNNQAPADFDLDHFLKHRLFRSAPLLLSTLPEFQRRTGVPELLNDLRRHHRTLRETRQQGFVAASRTGYQQEPLRPADCFLEPAFLSATYGLQGRLDLLHESATGYDLVELKSSTRVPFDQPWSNHAAQAQLYRLLLESVFGADGETAGRGRTSILYSNAATGQAPVRRVDHDPALVDGLLAVRN